MRLLFWNLGQSGRAADLLPDLVAENEVDVVVLAEAAEFRTSITATISTKSSRKYFPDPVQTNRRLTWFSVYPWSTTSHIDDDHGISIKEISPPIGAPVLVAGIHAASQLYRTPADLNELIRRHSTAVKKAEGKQKHDRTVVIGDFNLNPFETGIVSSESFHAVMDRRLATTGSRTVQGRKQPFFFNPMWSLYGQDQNGALGSYYYKSSSSVELFWHCLDQALVRPALLSRIGPQPVKFVTAINGIAIFSPGKGSKISDHLPLLLTVQEIEHVI